MRGSGAAVARNPVSMMSGPYMPEKSSKPVAMRQPLVLMVQTQEVMLYT
jgi:hypothetical protein